jgi:hypothetical protein
MEQAFEFKRRFWTDAFAIKPGEQSRGAGSVKTLVVIKDPYIQDPTSSPLQRRRRLEKHLEIKGCEKEVNLFQIPEFRMKIEIQKN